MTLRNTLMILACNLAFFTCSFAATVTWDGDAGDNNWMSPTNWDTDMIPTAADDVFINSATVMLPSSTTVQRINMEGTSFLTIDASVVLTITGFAGNDFGFDVNNSVTVTNNGTLDISNIIGGTAADGLYVRGTFINNGTVTIDNIGRHGLYIIRGNFTNNAGATMTITDAGQINTDGDNIYIDDSSGIFGLLTNDGTITLNKTNTTGDDAIYINDNTTFDNNGMISISIAGGSSNNALRLDDGGTFNNNMGATFTADGGDDDQIFIDNTGAVYNNFGTINLSNVDASDGGLYITDAGTFNNESTGAITINGGGGTGILIDANSEATPATLNNAGSIIIQNMLTDGVRMQEAGVLNNDVGATITFSSTVGDDAIEMDNPSVFNNSGTINILNAADVGIDNEGDFNNMSVGFVNIDAIPDHQILLNGTATFDNAGTLDLDDGTKSGFNITDASIFTNAATGVVEIDGSTEAGIVVDATGSAISPKLDNSGAITVQNSSQDGLRLRDNGIFNNLAGGTLTLNSSGDKGIEFNSDTGEGINNALTNAGTITIDGSLGHGIDLTEGMLTNDGTITILDYGVDTSDDGIRLQGGDLTNNAGSTLSITGNGDANDAIELDASSTIDNSGSIIISNADDDGLHSEGTFNNMTGALFQANNCARDGIRMEGIGTFANDGDIRINNSADNDIETDNNAFNNTANATFAPGASPGLLEIRDNFDFGSSTITIEINGLTPITEFDRIENISGGTMVFSSATVELDWGTYVPEVGDEFRIVAGGGAVTGPFAMVNSSNPAISYDANYDATGIEIEVTAVLPVELVDFSAIKSARGAELSWKTATEINNEGFDIERSTDNERWTSIGYVNGNGNSNTAIQYEFLDNAPAAGTNYYRLKQNDFDGQFEYSRVVALDFNHGKLDVAAYPNPVKDVLYLNLDDNLDNVEIQIQDVNGKVLWTQQGAVSEIPFETYSPGVYLLNIMSDSSQTVQRIVHD